jgi:RNA polymerase sigma factor (sigma-70 family)
VEELAYSTGVSYKAACKYATMSLGRGSDKLDDLTTEDSTYESALRLEQREKLLTRLRELKPRNYDMLNQYYFNEKPLRDIGKEFGIKERSVQELISKTVKMVGRGL